MTKAALRPGISASVMCVNFLDTKKDLDALVRAGIDYLHFDIMDGEFVPNYALGTGMAAALRDFPLPRDIHLMVRRPEAKIPYFDIGPGDAVSVHAESTVHLHRVLGSIRSLGAAAGVALNPATPLNVLEYVMDALDFVLIMTVNPGFAGQQMVPSALKKIREARTFLDERDGADILIQVDGNVSFENAARMAKAGAQNFVAGTAGLFRRDMDIPQAAAALRKAIDCKGK
jgi:ribulose-phosphate 3-epimerase